MSELRLGIVGCGRIVERGYLPALRSARGIRLAAVADRVLGRAASAADGVPAFDDARTLVESELVDAVLVATRVDSHLAIARTATEAGLPVLVEKPPARHAHEARELAALDPPPSIGFNRRFDPELAAIRAALPPEGPVDLRLRLETRQGAWNSHASPDPVLLDLGTHLVDLAAWLAGTPPLRVRAELTPVRTRLELGLGRGRGRATVTCATNRPYVETIEAFAGGNAVARRRAGGFVRNAAAVLRSAPSPLVPSLARQLEAFAASVQGRGGGDLATGADAVVALAAVDSAYASARVGSDWVDLVPDHLAACSPSSSSTP